VISFKDFFGNCFLLPSNQVFKKLAIAAPNGQCGHFVQRLHRPHTHNALLCAGARHGKMRAGAVALVFGQFFAHGGRIGFAVAPFQIGKMPSKACSRLKVVPRSMR
jgi:hypothetical protein